MAFWQALANSSGMASCCLSVQALFLAFVLSWGAWLSSIDSANQGMTKANTPYKFIFNLVLLLSVILSEKLLKRVFFQFFSYTRPYYFTKLTAYFLICAFLCAFGSYNNFDIELPFRMAQPLSAVSFFYFWVAVLSFFHNYFLLMTLHFCIKSIIKRVVVIVTFAASPYEKVEIQALRLNRASNMGVLSLF